MEETYVFCVREMLCCGYLLERDSPYHSDRVPQLWQFSKFHRIYSFPKAVIIHLQQSCNESTKHSDQF